MKALKGGKNYVLKSRIASFLLVFVFVFTGTLDSTPPIYKTIKREQRESYSPKNEELMRIWIVYVDQGDGILIQLPSRYNYDLKKNGRSERLDVLIDGGSFEAKDEKRMMNFLHAIYPQSPITIEHMILSHHDSDHIRGLTKILQDPTIMVQHIYHSGLATYKPKQEILDDVNKSTGAIVNKKDKKIIQVMASLERDGITLKSNYLISNLNQLKSKYGQDAFVDLYNNFAQAISDKTEPRDVVDFPRVWETQRFVNEAETHERHTLPDIDFKLIWPLNALCSYKKNWGKTINGNSVTFRLKYGDFEMLFPGDQNTLSEAAMIQHLKDMKQDDLLKSDVLKAPHHGSKDNLEDFFKAVQPVLTVASLGRQGVVSNWKHPSTEVIQWAGGAHHFYSTYLHERKFNWDEMKTEEYRNKMIEKTHILIETDGKWFRLVEIDSSLNEFSKIPTVEQTSRGNGTCWIKAY